MNDNPLSKLYRNKNIFLSLPSKGNYYPSGINLSIDGEIGIYPMTAKDEIMLKSPDALYNGTAIIDLIKSCVPDIKNPEEMPSCDVDPLMIAIRAAGNKKVEISSKCNNCGHENEYDIDVTHVLSTAKPISENNVVVIDDAKIYCRPYTLKSQIKANMQRFNQVRLEMVINKKVDLEESKRLEIFNKLVEETTQLTFEIVAENILKVESNDFVVEDKKHIIEWVENMEKDTYYKIIGKIRELSDNGMQNELEVSCGKCNSKNKILVDMNPMTFFT